jgi:hypothetical protein
MIPPALSKFLSVLSLATIATTVIVNPAFAEPTTYQGSKGTYTIDIGAGTYRGCLDDGGCISLGRKNLIKITNAEFSGTRWKNGEYTYSINDSELKVAQNGRIIFQDSLSIRSSAVGQGTRPKPVTSKVKRNTECRTLTECNRAIEINPESSDAYLNRANFFESKYNNVKDATADYDKAVELNPENPYVYLKRAKFKSNNWGSFGDVSISDDYNKAVAVAPQNSDVYLLRGKELYHSRMDYDRELDDYNQAIEINPKNSSAYLSRAELKQKLSDPQGALIDCRLSLQYASTPTDKSLAKECISRIDNR